MRGIQLNVLQKRGRVFYDQEKKQFIHKRIKIKNLYNVNTRGIYQNVEKQKKWRARLLKERNNILRNTLMFSIFWLIFFTVMFYSTCADVIQYVSVFFTGLPQQKHQQHLRHHSFNLSVVFCWNILIYLFKYVFPYVYIFLSRS